MQMFRAPLCCSVGHSGVAVVPVPVVSPRLRGALSQLKEAEVEQSGRTGIDQFSPLRGEILPYGEASDLHLNFIILCFFIFTLSIYF